VTPTLQRVIGVASLAAAIFNITVGAAIFVLPAHVAGSARRRPRRSAGRYIVRRGYCRADMERL